MKRRLTDRQKHHISKRHQQRASQENLAEARVVTHHGTQLVLEAPDGRHFRAHARRTLGSLTTGDHVGWKQEEDQLPTVELLHPRRNALIRPDTHGKPKLMASNIDQVLIVIAPIPLMNPNVIERTLVATLDLPAKPLIVLNKIDLMDHADVDTESLERLLTLWQSLGFDVIRISAKHALGMNALREALTDKVSMMIGLSGVGKTSLTRRLVPAAEKAEIQELSASNEGQHTTRASTLYRLADDSGGLIDAPGVRDFSVTDLTPLAIDRAFPEIVEQAAYCRFNNCQHLAEPGCAVRDADPSVIDSRRLTHYLDLMAEARQG